MIRTHPRRLLDLWQRLVHEFLASKPRLDRHNEQNINLLEKRQRPVERSTGPDSKAGRTPRCADAGQRGAYIMLGLQVNANAMGVLRESRKKMIRPRYHQVNIQRPRRTLSRGRDERRSKRNIIHEMPIHDVHMQPVGSGLLRANDFLSQSPKVAGENRRSDDEWIWSNHVSNSG